ncbi:hypothetical protein GCM10017774_50330 [Lentzea cavernae]|uniref:Secreted protein n=1 Tax=Lentzea cavernae TaxID=2020703 RepID=A0ABQ3MHL6_9PSEU|nr:hypothetical protein GCM10017774_50330 [Lentzea cavernae]
MSGSCFGAAPAAGVSTMLVAISAPVTAAIPPLKYFLTVWISFCPRTAGWGRACIRGEGVKPAFNTPG